MFMTGVLCTVRGAQVYLFLSLDAETTPAVEMVGLKVFAILSTMELMEIRSCSFVLRWIPLTTMVDNLGL